MKTIKNIFQLSIYFVLLVSCSEKEAYPEREYIVDAAIVEPNIGGANEPNQLYFDFSSNTQAVVQRDSWDLRFYCGNEFRVSLNTSIYMATKSLESTNLNAVNTAEVQNLFNTVATGTFNANNVAYVDDFDGDILNTAIAEVNEIDTENKVYLLNLGYEVATNTPPIGNVAAAGEHRGWKKIRILKQEEKYLLQYADLDDITYKEVEITKDANYNFTFFSFNTNTIVDVEPEKQKWDICFTIFTNQIPGFGTYGYTDYIISNNLQNVKAYSVSNDNYDYDTFIQADIIEENFITSQRAIGSSWRLGGGPGVSPQVKNGIFYILKDTEGFYYKIKFTTLTNIEGERGNPQFQYTLTRI